MSDWSSTWWGGTATEEDDDDALETEHEVQCDMRDSLILVFDCSLAMFQKSGDEIPFQLCVKCALSVLKNKIISSDKDLVGIVFFGTEKRKNTSDFNHVYIFQDLDMPDAERILQLEKFLKDDSCDNFQDTFGHSTAYSVNDVLWTCSNMFSKSSRKGGHKRLMLFTNNDNPHADNPALQRQAKTRARDLSEIGILIELMHMQPSNHSFDSSLFYQDVVEMGEGDGGLLPDPAQNFEELLTRVQKKQHGKRAVTTVPFILSEGVELGVSLFNVRASAKKSSCINLDSRTNEPVKTHTKYICVDTGRELLPTDIKLYQMFGGEKVIFEKEEVTEMKNFGAPGLLLMGFKPRSSLKRYFHIKPAQFLYPSEKSEEVDEHNVQINAPGFHVMFLPFADDLRRLKYDTPHKATPEQVNKAKEVIKKLTTGFDSLQFLNPSLQKHYKNLEALALDRDEPEKVADLTEPLVEVIDRKAGQVMKEFKELVFPDNYNPGDKATAKRKQAGETTGTSARRSKTDGEGEINMEEEAQQGRLAKLTVPVLKEFVRQAGIKCGTKKADLVEAIKQHFGV